MHTVEVATRDDRQRTAHAYTCIASVTADRSRLWYVAYFRTTVTESFLVGFSQPSHSRLAHCNTFATMCLFIKSAKNWLQTKPAKMTKSLSFEIERWHLKGLGSSELNTFPVNVVTFFAQIIIYHMLITGKKNYVGYLDEILHYSVV